LRSLWPPPPPPKFKEIKPPDPKPKPQKPPPVGISHVYARLQERLTQQRDTVDRIDSKAAVLIGFLSVFLAGVASISKDVYGIEHSRLGVIALLAASILFGLKALWARRWQSPPNPRDVIRQELYSREDAEAENTAGAYASVLINQALLDNKRWWFDASLILLAVSVLLFVLSVAFKIGGQKF
jgi:hypothetical protein